jgi:hypothetical protein
MPGFKGKRKGGLTLTLYKKTFRYTMFVYCLYHRQGNEEEASVVEAFQDVLDKLSDVGKKDKLLKFFKLVQDGKFPLNNIALLPVSPPRKRTKTYSALKILLKCHFHFLGQT